MSQVSPENHPDRTGVKQGRRRRTLRRLLAGLALLSAALGVDYFAYPYGLPPGGRSMNRGENGLWLRYTWYFGRNDDKLPELTENFRRHHIRYAWFHVRSITKEGALEYRYEDRARWLVRSLRRQAPSVRLMAWVYAGNRAGRGEVDLRKPGVRQRMVREAVWLVRACGFDGVQWDYEICPDDDRDFLSLMRETRAALPQGALLSAACPVWLPFPLGRWGWSLEYYAKVAQTCDQIAVMCYDTGFVTPRAYVWLTRQQVQQVTRAVRQGNPRCRVLIGMPTYGAGFRSHNPRAENIALSLRGVREGLADPRADTSVFAGVAPFADYTTDADEWRTYDAVWPRAGETVP